jgi:hypothetical protein
MPTSIDERLADLIQTKLDAIAPGGGFEEDVQAAHRASDSPPPMEAPNLPAVQLRRLATTQEPHLRGAYECVASFQVICIAQRDASNEKISDLIADVCKVIASNERWDVGGGVFLARRTWITGCAFHETETDEETMTGNVDFSVLFRVAEADPFTVKEV